MIGACINGHGLPAIGCMGISCITMWICVYMLVSSEVQILRYQWVVPVFTVPVFYVVAYTCLLHVPVFCVCLQADMFQGWYGGGNCLCTIEVLFVVSLIAFHVSTLNGSTLLIYKQTCTCDSINDKMVLILASQTCYATNNVYLIIQFGIPSKVKYTRNQSSNGLYD